MLDLRFFSFLLALLKWSVKIYELCHAIYKEKKIIQSIYKEKFRDMTKLKLV